MFSLLNALYKFPLFLIICFYQVVYAQPKIINGVSVPADFPELIVTINNNPSPGKIFTSNTSGSSYYVMIYENNGTPYYYKKVDHYSTDFKVQPNGILSRYSSSAGGFITINNNFETTGIYATQEYDTDEHDFLITPEGTFLMLGLVIETRDMSLEVPGGDPNATILSSVIQELDADNSLLFEWMTADYFSFSDAHYESLTASRIDWIHSNSIALDYDGNILLSSRHVSECTKIDRITGEIIWRLGGMNNEFVFINEELEFSYQHAFYPVEGAPGHYIIYDNGNHRGQFSRVVEYEITIDDDTKTAEKVWEFRCEPDFYTPRAGNAQRLPNGNTFINLEQPQYPKAVEVAPNGEIVYEADFSPQAEAHKVFRFEWEGVMNAPYLLSEPLTGSVRLLFNKFGDADVLKYNIYGGAHPDNLTLISEENVTWADIDLRPFAEYEKYFFGVKSVSNEGSESEYSNIVEVQFENLFIGQSNGILGNSLDIEIYDPQWRNSQPGFGSSLSFDGVDDFINCGNDNSLQISGHRLTLEAWINPAEFKTNPNDGFILGKNNLAQDNYTGYSLSCGASGTVYFSIGNNTLYEVMTNSRALAVNQWQHVAAVFNGSSLKIYIDGNLAAENTIENTTIGNAATKNLIIGDSPFYGDRHFRGLIDEVRIWNVARSQEQIQTLMNNQIDPEIYSDPSNGLVGYWQINEGAGQTIEDFAIDNNMLLNGDFSNADNAWELLLSNNANATGSVNNEDKYFVDISNGGSLRRDIKLSQNNIWLIKDNEYTLEFDAFSDGSKTIGLDISNPQTPWIDYAKIGFIQVTSVLKHYQYSFTMENNSDSQTDIIFLLGENDFNFYLDNVRLTCDIATSVISDFDISTDYKLIGNFPNPFNPSTTIEYFLPELSNVKISIYNILGQLVQTLFDDLQNGGNHKIHFNGIQISSGVYFYTIEAKSVSTKKYFFDAKKMVLLK